MNSAYCGVCGRQYSECVCGPAEQGVERAADILAARIQAERARIAALERVAEALRIVVEDVRQLDGTCPHATWAEARDALQALDAWNRCVRGRDGDG